MKQTDLQVHSGSIEQWEDCPQCHSEFQECGWEIRTRSYLVVVNVFRLSLHEASIVSRFQLGKWKHSKNASPGIAIVLSTDLFSQIHGPKSIEITGLFKACPSVALKLCLEHDYNSCILLFSWNCELMHERFRKVIFMYISMPLQTHMSSLNLERVNWIGRVKRPCPGSAMAKSISLPQPSEVLWPAA